MKFISLFSGVGGFDLGMEQAGHECVAQVEWNEQAAGVLKKRWPHVPLFADVTKVKAEDLPDCDFITYGFPCQDLSMAGNRAGLQGKRSGLFYESTRLFRELRRQGRGILFALAENVEGLLSADDGIALANCIRELLDCGASEVGWRILDSQYFGIPQRRRRVFLASDFTGQRSNEILAIEESLRRYPPPKRRSPPNLSNPSDFEGSAGVDVYNGQVTGDTACTLTTAVGMPNTSGPKVVQRAICVSSMSVNSNTAVCISTNTGSPTGNGPKVLTDNGKLILRRITPTEAERLQGFPDGWTSERVGVELDKNIWKSNGKTKQQADVQRYLQMGNAVSVPVAKWLGKRIGSALRA